MKALFPLALAACITWPGVVLVCAGQTYNQSRDLLNSLLEKNDRRLRPNLNQSQPTLINISLALLSIDELDEINSKFAVTAFLNITWVNEIIHWNAEANDGIYSLKFPVTDVWYPEFLLGYSHGRFDSSVEKWMHVIIYNSGFSIFNPGDSFHSTCRADVTYYPFDVQDCTLLLVVWASGKSEVEIHTPEPYIYGAYFIENGEWEIIENSSSTLNMTQSKSSASFRFVIKRKSTFFVVNIILPIIVMSVLNIMVFALPPQSGERVSYSITVLLAIAVFLTIVGENLPKTSNPMSLLCYFLMINLITSACICVLAIINMRLYFREDVGGMPSWTRVLINITTCSRQNNGLQNISEEELNAEIKDEPFPIKPVSSTDALYERRYSWIDVSNAVDKLAMTFFLIVTITTSTGFMMYVTRQ